MSDRALWTDDGKFFIGDLYYCDECWRECVVNDTMIKQRPPATGAEVSLKSIMNIGVTKILSSPPDTNGGAGDDGGAYCSRCEPRKTLTVIYKHNKT